MIYCKRCVQPDTRPGIYFKDGVCGACLYEDDKKTIDWAKRKTELEQIAREAISKRNNYDCVIGISGGKDSLFQSLYARDILKLHPLLVNSEPEGITEIGKKNIENIKNLGFDVIALRPNPVVIKQLIKKDFYEFLNPVKVTEFSLWSSTYIIADKFNVPLIIQGENPGLTLGASKTGVGVDGDALNANKQDTLSTGWERYISNGIEKEDLFMYHYDREAIKKSGIKGVWLQYYVKEWSQSHNAQFSVNHGLTIRHNFNPEDIGTHIPYAQLDSDLVQVNQMLKYYKFGFGQCTDGACYDIRAELITRKQGIDLVEKYDGKVADRYVKKFCDYIGIETEEFWMVVNSFVNTELFEYSNSRWMPKFKVGEGL